MQMNQQIIAPRDLSLFLSDFKNQLPPFAKYSNPSEQTLSFCKEFYSCGIKNIEHSSNANLYALSYVFLIICYKDHKKRQSLLREILNHSTYFCQLLKLPYQTQSIKPQHIVKVVYSLLNYLSPDNLKMNIYQFLHQYFSAIQVLSLFFRVLLWKLKFFSAQSYTSKLNTNQIFSILTQYFEIKCEKRNPFYIFNKEGIFIYSPHDQQFSFGRFYEDMGKLYESEEVIRKVQYENFDKQKSASSIFEKQSNFTVSVNITQVKNEEKVQSDCPTQKISNQQQKSKPMDCLNLKEQSSILNTDLNINYSFKNEDSPVSQYIQDEKNQNLQNNNQNQGIRKTDLNLGGNQFKYYHEQRENCNNPEHQEEEKDKVDLISPYSENVLHHIGASRYLNDFLPETPRSKDQIFPKLSAKMSTSNCFEVIKQQSYVKKKKVQTFDIPQSQCTCQCTTVKQERIQLQSNVMKVVITPTKAKNSQKLLFKPLLTKINNKQKKIGSPTLIKSKFPSFLQANRQKKQSQQKTIKMKSPSFKERSFHIKSQPVIKNLREPLIPTIDMTKKKEKSKYPIYVSPQPLSHKFAQYDSEKTLRKKLHFKSFMTPKGFKYQ